MSPSALGQHALGGRRAHLLHNGTVQLGQEGAVAVARSSSGQRRVRSLPSGVQGGQAATVTLIHAHSCKSMEQPHTEASFGRLHSAHAAGLVLSNLAAA